MSVPILHDIDHHGNKVANATLESVTLLDSQPGQLLKVGGDRKVTGVFETIRELLFTTRTYYVRNDGNDANDGLANTAAGAFKTIPKAIDIASSTLDLGISNVNIKLANGTYSYLQGIKLKSFVGAGKIIISGDIANPANVIVQTTTNGGAENGFAIFESIASACVYVLEGMLLQSSGTNFRAILTNAPNSTIEYRNLIIGSGFIRGICTFGGLIRCIGNYTITSGAQMHFEVVGQGTLKCEFQPTVITVTNTPNFSIAFLYVNGLSYAYIASFAGYVSFSGAATGKKYDVSALSYVTGTQNNANYLPGSIGGTVSPNSQYA